MEYRNDAWTKPETLMAHTVRGIRVNPMHTIEYGQSEVTIASRKTFCRACAQPIIKGEKRLTFCYDYAGSGSWTAVVSHMHLTDCTGVLLPADLRKIGNNRAIDSNGDLVA